MSKPVITRDGDKWLYVWPEPGIAITLDRVHERSDGVMAECLIQDIKNGQDGNARHVARRTLNLLASMTRGRFSTELSERTGGQITKQDWESWLEQASELTVRALREGEPFIVTASREPTLEPRYLVEYLLPENETTIIAGDGMAGKGWAAMVVALAVCEGRECLPGIRPVRQGRVMYLDWETGFDEIRRRQAWVERGMGVEIPYPLIYRHMSRGVSDDLTILRDEVRSQAVDLVIVDSLGPATADELEAAHAAIRVMGALREIPCTKLVLAHVSKATAGQPNGRGRTFGSAMFDNQSRSMWEMRREEGSTEIALFHRKSNIGKLRDQIVYKQHWDDLGYRFWLEETDLSQTADLKHYQKLRVRCQQALMNGKMSLPALAAAMEIKPDSLRPQLQNWHEFACLHEGGGRGNPSIWGLADNIHSTADLDQLWEDK